MATETTTMQAGPELDALVAEKVMGWRWHDRMLCWYTPGCTVGETRSRREWTPSTSPAAAWEVVEAMRAKGWPPLVNWLGRDRKCWHCYFEHESSPVLIVDTEGNRWNDDEIRGAHAYADTMPEAVCRAALSALATRPRT